MTKQEILNLIDTTIKPNNKKAISAQSLQNVLREMAEASGEESGSSDNTGAGLQYAVERIIYASVDDEPLTEEQLAYNIETYEMFTNDGIPVFFVSAFGGIDPKIGLEGEICFEMSVGFYKFIFALHPDGNATTEELTNILFRDEESSATNLMTIVNIFKSGMVHNEPIFIWPYNVAYGLFIRIVVDYDLIDDNTFVCYYWNKTTMMKATFDISTGLCTSIENA